MGFLLGHNATPYHFDIALASTVEIVTGITASVLVMFSLFFFLFYYGYLMLDSVDTILCKGDNVVE